jgi:hypothetical protein
MCEHKNFESGVVVTRILDTDAAIISNYMASVRIRCADCGLPFEFIGFEGGFSFLKPMTDPFGKELRLPIQPSKDPVDNVNALLTQ